jgi:hypothetical protein
MSRLPLRDFVTVFAKVIPNSCNLYLSSRELNIPCVVFHSLKLCRMTKGTWPRFFRNTEIFFLLVSLLRL